MTVRYDQKTGLITFPFGITFSGYSGHGEGLNNPTMEAVVGVGPIPAGAWSIVEWMDHYGDKGPQVARLAPIGHNAHGRSGFLIHGDNSFMNHTASDGCIIAARNVRDAWRKSGGSSILVFHDGEANV